jgi:SAM-dependent methyltransferase
MHARLGHPAQVLLERTLGVLDAPALAGIVELGVPDHLDAPRTSAELARRVGADEASLDRVLAYLASRGCLRRDRRGRYRANRVTRLLVRDNPWNGWPRFIGASWTLAAIAELPTALRDGTDPVVAAHGLNFFEYVAKHSSAAETFYTSQAAGAELQAIVGAHHLPLDSARAVLDVGGGTGTLLTHILAGHPHLRGAVLDLPAAEAGARSHFAEANVGDRASFFAGDFFASIPRGYDLHLLTAIIHDWGDDDCVRILSNCARALAPGGSVCVIETELHPGRVGAFVQAADTLMLAFTRGGRERQSSEFEALWARAGLRCVKRTALASEGTLFQLQPAS